MAKSEKTIKKPQTEKARGKYDDKLKVKGSFLDIMKAATKDADKKKNEPKP